MAKEYDFSAFDDEKEAPSKDEYDFSAFDPTRMPAAAESGSGDPLENLEDLARATTQGALFGFGDEISGGLDTLSDAALGKIDVTKDLASAYERNRDVSREAFKKSEERSPNLSVAGNLIGGIAPALLTGGGSIAAKAALTGAKEAGAVAKFLSALKSGAGYGALAGAGTSEADLTKGEIGEFALDTGLGAVGGGVAGGVLQGGVSVAQGVGKLGGKLGEAIADSRIGERFREARGYGQEGIGTWGSKALKSSEKDIVDKAKEFGLDVMATRQGAGSKMGAAEKAIEASGKTFNITDDLVPAGNLIDDLASSTNPRAKADSEFLGNYLESLSDDGVDLNNLSVKQMKDIVSTFNDFAGTKTNAPVLKTDDAINAIKNLAKNLKGKLTDDPAYAAANNEYAAASQAIKTIGLNPKKDFTTDAGTKKKSLEIGAEEKIKNLFRRTGRGEETASGSNALERFEKSIRLLGVADEQKAATLGPEIIKTAKIRNITEQAQGFNPFNRSTFSKTIPIAAGNLLGKVERNLSNTQIVAMARDLMKKGPRGAKAAMELAEVTKKPKDDSVARNAALFTLYQNPEYRELLKPYFSNDEE